MDELWTPSWDGPRPFVHPVRTLRGATLTVDAPDDHPWHHALWSTIKFVNGENFWEEYDEYGLLHTRSVHDDRPGGRQRRVTARIEWCRPIGGDTEGAGPDGEVVIDEVRELEHVALDETAYAIDWTVELTPRVPVTLDRTPYTTWGGYGGLTLRGASDWTDTVLRLADDGATHEQLRGQRARWCHLSGVAPAAGEVGPVGVAILDHPDNPRHPSPWYASNRADTYGDGWANFCNAAFLWGGPLEVQAGEVLRTRHRVLVHDGELAPEEIERAWRDWVG